MSSTKSNRRPFSLDDFEKGLMLLGLIAPANVTEWNERESLEKHEAAAAQDRSKLYFRRAVLAAKIADELWQEATFGRVKFQKLVYLCEHSASMNLGKRYAKLTAGPFDHKFMHTIHQEFKKQQWFNVENVRDGKWSRSKYAPLGKRESYKKYYDNYFAEHAVNIQHIIDLFRKAKTDDTEIAATLFACRLELVERHQEVTEAALLDLFYNWSAHKSDFRRKQVLQLWSWMNQCGLVGRPK